MDKLLAELLGTAAAPLIEALNRNSANLERVIAGQEAAMAKLEGATGGTTRRGRPAKADAAPSTETPASGEKPVDPPSHPLLATPNGDTMMVKNSKTGADEATPTANFRASDFSRDQIKNEFIGWLGETTDPAAKKERSEFVSALGQHFGVAQVFHPTAGLTEDEQRKQVLFFLRRKREGLKVDFGAEYDFDGDPLADQTVDAADEDDAVDALG